MLFTCVICGKEYNVEKPTLIDASDKGKLANLGKAPQVFKVGVCIPCSKKQGWTSERMTKAIVDYITKNMNKWSP